MSRSTQRIKKAGVAALSAATALSSLVIFAPTAGAAPVSAAQLDLDQVSSTTIGIGKTAQTAGALRIANTGAATNTLSSGDQLLITAAPNGGNGVCAVPSATLEFAALPTVAVTGTAAVVTTLESSSPACAAAGITDVVRINVSGAGTATAINISGITYNVGATALAGSVGVTGQIDPAGADPLTGFADGTASNALVTPAILTANNPPKGASELAGGSYAISPIVIAEQVSDIGDGDFCIDFAGDIVESTVTVTASGGTDTATATVDAANDTVFVDVTPVAPGSATTFSVAGVLHSTASKGLKQAILKGVGATPGECVTDQGETLSVATTAGYVGNDDRFGGADRFTTAALAFDDQFKTCPTDVIIARGDQFPDALAASYLAGGVNTGILLTNTNSVPAATLNAIRTHGVEHVYLMGGTSAISSAVATQLDNQQVFNCVGTPIADPQGNPVTLTVDRIAGADRYQTAQNVAEFLGLSNGGDADINGDDDCDEGAPTAIIASGESFPDALAAGPLAFSGDNVCEGSELPLLLTQAGSVPAATQAALINLGIENVIVVGGTAAVSDAAVAQLTAAGYNVRRIAGASRTATAAALATAMIVEWGYIGSNNNVTLARGDAFADALASGPFSGKRNWVTVLTASPTSLSAETAALFASWRTTFPGVLDDFDVLGGTGAVSQAVVQAALDAASQQSQQ
jgi:putative cell wall-binding protein